MVARSQIARYTGESLPTLPSLRKSPILRWNFPHDLTYIYGWLPNEAAATLRVSDGYDSKGAEIPAMALGIIFFEL
jgi:hypothetical protein